jgi:hypothetical protein
MSRAVWPVRRVPGREEVRIMALWDILVAVLVVCLIILLVRRS